MELKDQPGKLTSLSDFLMNALRRRLEKNRSILIVRAVRRLIHFGPWRAAPQFLIRQLRPVAQNHNENQPSLLGTLCANSIAKEIRQDSIAMANSLPLDFVNRLRTITDQLKVDHYQLMHHIDGDIRQLTNDPAIRSVLRAYFDCEPELLECTLVVTGSSQHQTLSEQNEFHFDYAGWESLNVFVYLTNVTVESAHHIIVKGSHRKMGLRDVIQGSVTSAEALRRFGPSIHCVTGPAGTVFFENTEAYHRRQLSEERRVMLNILYASHRGFFSRGRSSRDHIENRARAYERGQAVGTAVEHNS